MASSKKATTAKLAVAMQQAKSQASDLQERVAPAVEEARDRISPLMEDARDRLTPMMDDARGRLADSLQTVAAKLDDTLPDAATPAFVTEAAKPAKGGKLKKLLVVAGLGAAVAVVAKKVRGGAQPTWQSAPTPPPAPRPTPAAGAPTQAAPVTPATTSIDDNDTQPSGGPATSQDKAGGTPEEAASDSVDTPHKPTTPDAPAEKIDLKP